MVRVWLPFNQNLSDLVVQEKSISLKTFQFTISINTIYSMDEMQLVYSCHKHFVLLLLAALFYQQNHAFKFVLCAMMNLILSKINLFLFVVEPRVNGERLIFNLYYSGGLEELVILL